MSLCDVIYVANALASEYWLDQGSTSPVSSCVKPDPGSEKSGFHFEF